MAQTTPHAYQFGPFLFDVRDERLLRDGQPIELSPKATRVLLTLLEAGGHLVGRDELDRRVWGDTEVGLGSLTYQVHHLRKALGEERDGQRFIETVPRRGYRFVAPIRHVTTAGAPMVLPEQAVAAATPPSNPSPRRRPHRSHPPGPRLWSSGRFGVRTAAAAFVATLAGATAATGLWRRPAMPYVTSYVQLSHDGRAKSIGHPMLVDGARVYFREGIGATLASVSTSGGETSPVHISPGMEISDIDESSSAYLAIRRFPEASAGELWTVPMLSGPSRQVGEARCWWAEWSPDRTRIACTTSSSVSLLGPDGTGVTLVTLREGHPGWPRWSPDGRRLRFTVDVAANRVVTRTIWEVGADGSGFRQLLPGWTKAMNPCCGSWSPDGRQFVFEARVGETSQLWLLRDDPGLWATAPADEPTRLTDGPLSFYLPTWSADGTTVFALGVLPGGELVRYEAALRAFIPYLQGISATWVSFPRRGDLMVYSSFPQHAVWRARLDGTDKRQLTFPPLEVDGAQVSPDGRWVALRAALPGRQKKVYLVSSDGGTPVPLTSQDVAQGIPSWSDDSSKIAYGDVPAVFGRPDGGEVIHVYDLASRQSSTVPGSHGLWTSRWSPDGRYLAALTIRGQQLRLFDTRTNRWRQVLADHVGNPSWSRDSKYLYYDTEGKIRALRRVRVSDGRVEHITDLETIATPAFSWGGLSQDDSPILLRSVGAHEVYALRVSLR